MDKPSEDDMFQKIQKEIVNVDLSSYLDKGIDTVAGLVKQSTAAAGELANHAKMQLKEVADVGTSAIEQADAAAIGALKQAVLAAHDNQIATASALGLLALALPAPRKLLWRLTLGRLRSVEAAELSAEGRIASLKETIGKQQVEGRTLHEKLKAAQDEHARTLSNLKGVGAELHRFTSAVRSTEKQAGAVLIDLRSIPSKKALALRSEAAQHMSAAYKERTVLEKTLASLAKQGL